MTYEKRRSKTSTTKATKEPSAINIKIIFCAHMWNFKNPYTYYNDCNAILLFFLRYYIPFVKWRWNAMRINMNQIFPIWNVKLYSIASAIRPCQIMFNVTFILITIYCAKSFNFHECRPTHQYILYMCTHWSYKCSLPKVSWICL